MLIERAGKFVRKQKDTAVEGAKKAAHTGAEMLGRGPDAAVTGSRRGLVVRHVSIFGHGHGINSAQSLTNHSTAHPNV